MSNAKRAAGFGTVISSQSVSVTTTATALTVPSGAVSAIVSADGNPSRVRFDGTAPTASAGHLVADGAWIEIGASDLAGFKLISTDAEAVAVFATFYGA